MIHACYTDGWLSDDQGRKCRCKKGTGFLQTVRETLAWWLPHIFTERYYVLYYINKISLWSIRPLIMFISDVLLEHREMLWLKGRVSILQDNLRCLHVKFTRKNLPFDIHINFSHLWLSHDEDSHRYISISSRTFTSMILLKIQNCIPCFITRKLACSIFKKFISNPVWPHKEVINVMSLVIILNHLIM